VQALHLCSGLHQESFSSHKVILPETPSWLSQLEFGLSRSAASFMPEIVSLWLWEVKPRLIIAAPLGAAFY